MILGDFGGCIPCGRRAQKFVTTERGYVYHREGLHSPPRGVTLLKSNSLLSLEPLAFIRLLFFWQKNAKLREKNRENAKISIFVTSLGGEIHTEKNNNVTN